MKKILYFFYLLLFLTYFSYAKTIIVDDSISYCASGDERYHLLSNALNYAANGDTIKICPGTYNNFSGFIINKKDLTIEGIGNSIDDVVLKSSGSYTLKITTSNTNHLVIKNLKIKNTAGYGMAVWADGNSDKNIWLQDIIINSRGQGLNFQNGFECISNITVNSKKEAIFAIPKSDITINGANITSQNKKGVYFGGGDWVNIKITNSKIISNRKIGLQVDKAESLLIDSVEIKGETRGLYLPGNVKNALVKNSIIRSTGNSDNNYALVLESTHPATIENNCFYGKRLLKIMNGGSTFTQNYYEDVEDSNNDGKITPSDSDKIWAGNESYMEDSNFKTVCNNSIDTTIIHPDCPCCSNAPTPPSVADTSDICYEDVYSEGWMCFYIGVCSGGIGCKNIVPIKNIGNVQLEDVNIYYDETGLSETFGNDCGVEPSGECETQSNIDFGPFGFLGQATHFSFDNPIAPNNTDEEVWTKNFTNMTCFGEDKFYVTYIKNGVLHYGKLNKCGGQNPPPPPPDENIIPDQNATELSAVCDTFADALQTHNPCPNSKIEFKAKANVYDNPDTELNSCEIVAPDWVIDQTETCESDDCSASGTPAQTLNLNYNNPPQTVTLDLNPSNSNENVTVTTNKTLNGYEYNQIEINQANATFNVTNQLKINQIKFTTNSTASFQSNNPYLLEIGSIGIKWNGSGNSITTDNNAKNIKIKSINLSYSTNIDLKASQTIQMENFTVGRGNSQITLQAKYVVINSLTLSNSGSGHANIKIKADYIDIENLNFGQDATLTIEPLTSGQRVLFRANSIQASSSSTMIVSSGNYYTSSFNIPGSSNVSSIRAKDENQLINFYINGDFKPGNNPGINSLGNNGNFGTLPPANFMLFINGDLETGGGGTTFNATIYVEGSASLGSPTYIKGALSAGDKIDLYNDTKVYYDQSIVDSGWGDCGNQPLTCGFRDFEIINPENTRNINGDFLVTGNTIECVTTWRYNFGGPCTNNHNYNDNGYMVKYIDIDNNTTTWNSSSAYLTLPDEFEEILWAGIFWQGNVNNFSYHGYNIQRRAIKNGTNWIYYYINNSSSINPNDTDANKILFKIDGFSDYIEITADKFDCDKWYLRNGAGDYGFIYAAYADITNIFKNYSFTPNQQLTLTVANITTNEGKERWLGDYGAWSVVVVYKGDKNSKFKRVLIYNGFKSLDDPNNRDGNPVTENIEVTELYLPTAGDVNSYFASFAGEGEQPYHPDKMQLENQNMPGARDPNNIFDARLANIDRPDTANNAVENTNGIDIDMYDVTSIMTNVRDNNPDTDKVTLTLSTDWDTYYPSMLAFSVELYQPKICYMETLYDSNGNEINGSSSVQVGDILKAHLLIRNDDNETARYVKIIKKFDENITKYEQNSTCVKDVDDNNLICYNDNTGPVEYDTNNKKLTVGFLGEGNPPIFKPYSIDSSHIAYVDYNFSVQTNQPFSLSYDTSYEFEIAGKIFEINSSLPKCIDFNNTITPYMPALGTYNVVNENFSGNSDPTDTNSSINSLYTQIVNKPFNVKVLHLGDDKVTLEDTTGAIFLDIVDATNITDENSCKNATKIYPLSGKSYAVYFGNKDSQTALKELNDINISIASKNATFRVKYMNWVEVIRNSGETCDDTSEMSETLKGVPACLDSRNKLDQVFPGNPCFDSSIGAPCSNGHGNPPYNHDFGCAQCLIDYHPYYVCARDNFSIRPNIYSMETNETILIGAKTYYLDINATRNGDDYNSTGYNQSIANSADKNITAKLIVPTGCSLSTNISPSPISTIQFINGKAENIIFKYNNVGDINITIHDNEWTKVDQQQKSDGSIDCIANSDTNISVNGKIGCLIKGEETFTFNPKEFKNSLSINNFNGGKFTYISNEKDMSASLKFIIEAILDDNTTATNYVANCFAKDINFTVSLINDKNLTWSTTKKRIRYFSNDSNYTILNTNEENITLKSSEGNFTSSLGGGIAQIEIGFNFDRNISKSDNPFLIYKNDFNISVTEINGTTKGEDFNRTIDQNATFYYGRVHSPDYSTKQNPFIGNVYFEIYDKSSFDPAGIKGKESVDDVYWYINKDHNSTNLGQIFNIKSKHNKIDAVIDTNVSGGVEKYKYTYNGTIYPYKDKMDINASSWLIFNRFDENAKTNHFYIEFHKASGGWAGKAGKTGKVIDLNISDRTQRRINW